MTKTTLIGRKRELDRLNACIQAGRNVLLEGAVGVGKTHLALAAAQSLGRPVHRIDGDSRYSEQKLSGWFDPPMVVKKGYGADSFVAGPLVEAMREGGILFINELNRLPEGVQNVLLPAIDEGMVLVPRLGEVRAKKGFLVIATQNPKEFVATSHLSEAILDRFELVVIDYQSESEEMQIVAGYAGAKAPCGAAVKVVRSTREHPRIRRGASVRAAISIAEISLALIKQGMSEEEAFMEAVLMALPTRIEVEREADSDRSHQAEIEAILKELAEEAWKNPSDSGSLKKKT